MGMVSGWMDQAAALRFRKDASGRSVFIPFALRKGGYYVDTASDEQKIKSLLKMYAVAGALINIMGYIGSFTIAQMLVVHRHRTVPLAQELGTALAVYFTSALVLYVLPALLLWKTYSGLIPDFCASFSAVGPEQILQMKKPPVPYRRQLIVAGVALLIVGLVIAVATGYVGHLKH